MSLGLTGDLILGNREVRTVGGSFSLDTFTKRQRKKRS